MTNDIATLLATALRWLMLAGAGDLLARAGQVSRSHEGTGRYHAMRGPGVLLLLSAGADGDARQPFSASKLYDSACYWARTIEERTTATLRRAALAGAHDATMWMSEMPRAQWHETLAAGSLAVDDHLLAKLGVDTSAGFTAEADAVADRYVTAFRDAVRSALGEPA